MSQLLKVYDTYNEFSRELYFTISHQTLPSKLILEVPMKSTKDNMSRVLETMNLSSHNYQLELKNWDTEDASNADFGKDFPYELIYNSQSEKSVIGISLRNDTLTINFLYDCKNTVLESWVIDMNDTLRKTYGLSRTPTFKVLTKRHSRFTTEEVRTEKVSLDIALNYNNDFLEISDKINHAITAKESGLILLYGKPGTGKTTYIRNLISEHQDANFIFVQNEFVNNLLDPDFISFLLKQRNSILIIEDAEKVITTRESINENSVVSTILQLTDGLFSDYLNIKVVCTFNTNLSKIDSALLRKGRMIAMYEFKPLTIKKTNQLLQSMGAEQSQNELTISDIYNHEEKEYTNIKKSKIGF
jgi:energy-coupling factor transporter ATP-binding protein EcfA2